MIFSPTFRCLLTLEVNVAVKMVVSIFAGIPSDRNLVSGVQVVTNQTLSHVSLLRLEKSNQRLIWINGDFTQTLDRKKHPSRIKN